MDEINWHITLQGKGPWSRDEAEAKVLELGASLVDRGFQAGLVNVTVGTRTSSYSFQAPDVAPAPDAAADR